jgi:hypothetical protein
MKSKQPPGDPMTLGHMRALGVQDLSEVKVANPEAP